MEPRQTYQYDDIGQGDAADWQARLLREDGSEFEVLFEGEVQGVVRWTMTGQHSVNNGLMAIAAARHVGVQPHHAVEALSEFAGVKRRMELIGEVDKVRIYDDFAHHPTAITTTLAGIRAKVGSERIIAVIEPRSNTMRLGTHQALLATSTDTADEVVWFQPEGMEWSLDQVVQQSTTSAQVLGSSEAIIQYLYEQHLKTQGQPCHIVIMSNGGFEGIHQRLYDRLKQEATH